VEAVTDVICTKPRQVELVLTGRYAPERILELADMVTEVREIKHPFGAGIAARKGIEF
jgi:cob(I)alamin adenosyltransferase